MATVQPREGTLKVFISYSRADEAFADELKLGLEDKGYTVEIDKHSIRAGEEWKARLGNLIKACDTVVFVLSPDSARSPICHWEVDEAHALAKRIVPVLHRGLHEPPKGKQADGTPWPEGPAEAPARLMLINYPRFDDGRSFMVGLRALVQALEDDLSWIERHSRLATRARDWDDGGRPANRLMSGADIAAAKALVAERKATAPPMLPLQLDFIQASKAHEAAQRSEREKELEEKRRLAEERQQLADELRVMAEKALAQSQLAVRRTQIGFVVAVVLAVAAAISGGLAWLQREEAEVQRGKALMEADAARAARGDALTAAEQAHAQAERAERGERDALFTQSGLLSEAAREVLKLPGGAPLAMLLALEGMPDKASDDPLQANRPLVAETEVQLDSAHHLDRERIVLAHNGGVQAVAWSPDGTRLATGSVDKTVRIVDVTTGRELARTAHARSIWALSWSPDGMRLAIGSGDLIIGRGEARIIEAATGQELTRVAHDREVWAVAWSPDGRRLATGAWDRTARIIDATTGQELTRVAHEGAVGAVAWSPDGARLATGSADKTVRIIEAASGKELARVSHDLEVWSVAWSPDGTRLATGSGGLIVSRGQARILEAASGKELARMPHEGAVWAVAWSPDGGRLAIGSDDRTARIMDPSSGRELARVAYNATVGAVSWSPLPPAADGSALLSTGSQDGTVRLWRVFTTTDALVQAAKARAARCLTPAQRQQYFLPPAPPTWCVERRLWPYHGDDWQAWLPKQRAWLASARRGDAPALPNSQ